MKKYVTIQSSKASLPLQIIGSRNFIDTVLSHPFWKEYVICQIVDKPSTRSTQNHITISESPTLRYDIQEQKVECNITCITSAIKFVSHLLEYYRQRKDIYTVHGNVITLGERSIALIGGISGIGKTSLSAKATQSGWEWTSDEKFLINDKAQYIQGLTGIQNDSKTKNASEGAFPVSPRNSRQICAFIVPIITEGTLVTYHYSINKATYHIYEELSRNITASRAILQGHPTPLPSVDNPDISTKRYLHAQTIAKTVPMHFTMGPVESILQKARELTL